jgi:hypothetical protein
MYWKVQKQPEMRYGFIGLLTLIILLNSCTEEAKRTFAGPKNAYGKLNDIVVIAEDMLWDGPVGDSIDYFFASAYPILPQPEPMYDLRHYSYAKIEAEPLLRELRTYLVVANLRDEDSAVTKMVRADLGEKNYEKAKADPTFTTMVGKDKWAKGQVLVYVFSFSEDGLVAALSRHYAAISKRVRTVERPHLHKRLFVGGEDLALRDRIRTKTGATLTLPKGYVVAMDKEGLTWLRMETDKASSNILIHQRPYTDKAQLSQAGIKAIRDELGKKYISSSIQGSYMRINDVDLPMYTYSKTMGKRYALEARGIWEMENDFMGGPFIGYLIHNQDKNELLYLDGFVYAPSEDKRNYIQYLEYLLSSVKY